MAILAARRQEWGEMEYPEGNNFRVHLRGGRWTYKHKRAEADFVTAVPRDGLARLFCRTYAFNLSYSFSLGLYGERGCHMMALKVCRR